jgi:hypothetical protein
LNIGRKLVEKILVSLKTDRNNGHLTFMIISCSILLGMKNISDKRCGENENTLYVQ